MRATLSNIEKRIAQIEQYTKRAPSKAQVMEVQAFLDELMEEYNSPEAKEQREQQYKELCEIGKLRKQAYENGEGMDKYPLPWENKPKPDDKWIDELVDKLEAIENEL